MFGISGGVKGLNATASAEVKHSTHWRPHGGLQQGQGGTAHAQHMVWFGRATASNLGGVSGNPPIFLRVADNTDDGVRSQVNQGVQPTLPRADQSDCHRNLDPESRQGCGQRLSWHRITKQEQADEGGQRGPLARRLAPRYGRKHPPGADRLLAI